MTGSARMWLLLAAACAKARADEIMDSPGWLETSRAHDWWLWWLEGRTLLAEAAS